MQANQSFASFHRDRAKSVEHPSKTSNLQNEGRVRDSRLSTNLKYVGWRHATICTSIN